MAFSQLAALSDRDEIWVPGYTCFSIPAAAVAAGLRVRLVEIGLDGRIDPNALARMPLERAAALVVSNLFGVPEPVARLREITNSRGVALVDDAAQSLGARSAEGPVGTRGEVGILSFGRGKPLSALGGGALAWYRRSSTWATSRWRPSGRSPGSPRRTRRRRLPSCCGWP